MHIAACLIAIAGLGAGIAAARRQGVASAPLQKRGTRTAAKRRHMSRLIVLLGVAFGIVGAVSSAADAQYAQYYPPGYRPPPQSYSPPPCYAVTPGPFGGAARGAAGGALFGAIAGNAGRGAAIGAAIGGISGAARRGAARSSGACY
jgi:Glycine-zipper domain